MTINVCDGTLGESEGGAKEGEGRRGESEREGARDKLTVTDVRGMYHSEPALSSV